ncbi:DUF4817 domain-containing protein [Trichonephila clavipes]|nr:DUF4817 domain-containing protein [Trichonephila clavipes]
MEQDPTCVFNILWTDEAHFSLHGDVNNHNCRIWVTSNPREYTQKPLNSPKVTAWCGFTGSFIIGPFFFEMQCPVNGWMTETVNAQRYLMLLRETVVPCVIQRGQISNVTFMQDGATSHTANPVKAFLIQTFGEDRIVSRRRRYPWLPRYPDLIPVDFWLWGFLKSHVFLSGPSSLSELKDAIRREISFIHPDMLHSAVAGFVSVHYLCIVSLICVLDESRSFFRVHTGYFSNIPKCIKAEFIASWACSQSSVVSSSQR